MITLLKNYFMVRYKILLTFNFNDLLSLFAFLSNINKLNKFGPKHLKKLEKEVTLVESIWKNAYSCWFHYQITSEKTQLSEYLKN